MASPATTKHCELCGTEYSTKRPGRAKYCTFCAAANAILHYGEDAKKCLACEAKFCVSDRRDILCASCDHNPRFCRAVVTGKCRYCDRSGVTVADKDIPVCFSCWKDPAVRPRLITTLAKKRAARIAANPAAATAGNEGDA
jgi:hypothetical protein